METTKKINHLKILRNTQVSPSLRIPQGVQVLLLGYFSKPHISIHSSRPSRLSFPALALALALFGSAFFSHSAYAAFSASISRTSSEAVALSDGSGTIKPSSSGTLGTGSDVVTVSSNCPAGYNLYVSATKDGSTSLTTDGGKDYIPSTITATGSESTLSKDTWGVGKDGTTFSKIPAYTADASSLAPLYTGTGDASSTATDYTVYYGANISTAKTPGTYTGNILYTVVMDEACLEYTLKFDDNGATASNLPDQIISFGQAVDLSEYSATNKISKTGYHLSGWKIKDGDGILLPTDNNTSLDDGKSSELTLIAQWEANTYTITYNANAPSGATVTGTTVEQTNQAYDSTITLRANGFTLNGYKFKGWAYQSTATTKDFDGEQANISVSALAENNASGSVVNTNGGTITLYAVWEIAIPDDGNKGTMQGYNCSSITPGHTATLTDTRDNQTYKIYRWPTTGTAGKDYPTSMSGYCIMAEDLALGLVTSGSITEDSNLALTTSDSAGAGTILVRSSRSDWSTTNSDSNLQYISATNSPYNSDYPRTNYYSYGASQIVCPKGWRPPTKAEYDNVITLMGGDNATGVSNITSAPYSFNKAGQMAYNGWQLGGSAGAAWSSTAASNLDGYRLVIFETRLYMHGGNTSDGKMVGYPSRCITDQQIDTSECSPSNPISATHACSLKDGKTWIMGLDGEQVHWYDYRSVNFSSETICPSSDWTVGNITDYDNMVKAYGGSYGARGNRTGYSENTGALYNALGIAPKSNIPDTPSGVGGHIWSTNLSSSELYHLRIYTNSSNTAYSAGTGVNNYGFFLCYKSS